MTVHSETHTMRVLISTLWSKGNRVQAVAQLYVSTWLSGWDPVDCIRCIACVCLQLATLLPTPVPLFLGRLTHSDSHRPRWPSSDRVCMSGRSSCILEPIVTQRPYIHRRRPLDRSFKLISKFAQGLLCPPTFYSI